MIRGCLVCVLVVFGCSNPEKDGGGVLKAAECFAMLCGEFSLDNIMMAKFNMEKCRCSQYSVSYKIFDDDACAISVWESDGRISLIRMESHLPSELLKYVVMEVEARWSYVEPQYGLCVLNHHSVSINLEQVLELLNAEDVISYSQMNFGCPYAKWAEADCLVYRFEIVDRPNLVMSLTLFSKTSWLIEVFQSQ